MQIAEKQKIDIIPVPRRCFIKYSTNCRNRLTVHWVLIIFENKWDFSVNPWRLFSLKVSILLLSTPELYGLELNFPSTPHPAEEFCLLWFAFIKRQEWWLSLCDGIRVTTTLTKHHFRNGGWEENVTFKRKMGFVNLVDNFQKEDDT